jgi:hypothetical protein
VQDLRSGTVLLPSILVAGRPPPISPQQLVSPARTRGGPKNSIADNKIVSTIKMTSCHGRFSPLEGAWLSHRSNSAAVATCSAHAGDVVALHFMMLRCVARMR